MSDELDEPLGALKSRAPFPVDWQAYSRQLLARLAAAEARRRRRMWSLSLFSACAGAAASLAIVFAFWGALRQHPPVVERPGPPAAELAPGGVPTPDSDELASWIVRGTAEGVSVARLSRPAGGQPDEMVMTEPFSRKFRRPDGGAAEIRFFGEGDAGEGAGSGIFAARRVLR
jgi:hypothetical protein